MSPGETTTNERTREDRATQLLECWKAEFCNSTWLWWWVNLLNKKPISFIELLKSHVVVDWTNLQLWSYMGKETLRPFILFLNFLYFYPNQVHTCGIWSMSGTPRVLAMTLADGNRYQYDLKLLSLCYQLFLPFVVPDQIIFKNWPRMLLAVHLQLHLSHLIMIMIMRPSGCL